MKLSLALLGTFLLSTTLAAPRSRHISPRNSNSNSTNIRAHQSIPKKISNKQSHKVTNTSHTDYSSNWGGAVIKAPPAGQIFNAVSGSFIVPTPSIPSNGLGTGESFAAAVWVGIDGDTYTNAILQTGVDLNVAADGSVSFDAWYEWYPDYSYTFDLAINAGDEVSMTVIASSSTEGTALVENISTGQQASIELSSTYELGGQNAEWIVEDFEENSQLVAFADFGTVTFTNCVATTEQERVGTNGATVIEIGDSGGQLTGVNIVNNKEVVVFWKPS
jgi:Peptidase A4 family